MIVPAVSEFQYICFALLRQLIGADKNAMNLDCLVIAKSHLWQQQFVKKSTVLPDFISLVWYLHSFHT